MKRISPITQPRKEIAEYDVALAWIVLALLSIGLVMVYSASIAIAEESKFTGYQPTYYLIRQSIYILVGLAFGVVAFQIKLETWQKLAPYLFLVGVALLLLVLVPGIGKSVNGSRRWLPLPLISLQPSEMMKLFTALYAADYTVRKQQIKHKLGKAFLPMFAVMALIGSLLLLEPDMGSFVVICIIALCILWLGNFNLKVFGALIVTLPLVFAALIISEPYRLKRVTGFMDPFADPDKTGYQLSHALIAFGRGELFGVGLGASIEKLFYLPKAHTDFLLAIIAEELGFVGVAVVLMLFAGLLIRAFSIGRLAAHLDRQFAALLAQGIAVWLSMQAMINVGVNMGVLPTKGLTLPFMSYGGSGMVMNCIAVAILLRIDWENRRMMRGQPI